MNKSDTLIFFNKEPLVAIFFLNFDKNPKRNDVFFNEIDSTVSFFLVPSRLVTQQKWNIDKNVKKWGIFKTEIKGNSMKFALNMDDIL